MLILHPYTVFGKPGTFVTAIFVLYGLWHGVKKEVAQTFLAPALILMLIGCFGAVVSIFNDILQLNHLVQVQQEENETLKTKLSAADDMKGWLTKQWEKTEKESLRFKEQLDAKKILNDMEEL